MYTHLNKIWEYSGGPKKVVMSRPKKIAANKSSESGEDAEQVLN
jgi:hypothetical protein